MWENTILVYTADHGSHFLTRGREAEYKRTCHDASIHIPLIITGPGFKGGNVVENVVSLLDVPATLLACAGIDRPEGFRGRDLRVLTDEQIGTKPPFCRSAKAVWDAPSVRRNIPMPCALQAMDTACLQAMYTTKSSFMC